MAVQVDVDNGTSTTPRAQLVEDRGRPMIRIARTVELYGVLNALAAHGLRQVSYRFRFFEDGDVTWRLTSCRGAGRGRVAPPSLLDGRDQLRQLLEAAIREATEGSVGSGRELVCEWKATFSPKARTWTFSGSGTVYEMDPELFDVGITLE